MRKCLLALALALSAAVAAAAQSQTGQIFGKATDTSGGVMPGVTVTATSPVLLQPLVAVTSDSGTYQFPQIPIGTYTVTFELSGFRTVVRQDIRIEIGFNAQVNAVLDIGALQENIQVTAESPVVDLRDTGKGTRFNLEALQTIPSARDPWVIIEQSAGVAMDRQNVGGSASGQQSNFVARGAATSQQKWNLDGVDITDMSATGGSPIYFDFDAFEEMQISTGGADVTMQSPGVAVNLVTKSGTDKVRGTGRFFVTDDRFQSQNVTDDLRRQGATTGNPIQNIKDYGFESGGPLKKGTAWFWGSVGRQKVDVGINNFFEPSAECQAMKSALAADPRAVSLDSVRTCLSTDQTLLNNYNAKFSVAVAKKNQASMFFNAAEKVRNARDASDLRPIETTYRQMGVDRPDLGSSWWKTGMPKSYKWSDRQIFTDRFMVEATYSHVGNNFELALHDPSLAAVQPAYEITTTAWSRSYQDVVYVRPTDSVDVVANYFKPGVLGGDHAIRAGLKIRDDIAHSESMYGGDAYARFRNGAATEAQLYRRGLTEYGLHNRNGYVQDTFTRGKTTIIAGLRFDYQTDYANPATVAASPLFGQATFAGVYSGATYSGQPFNQLPAISFAGADAGVAFKNWSPRVGLSYDINGDGHTVLKLNYARYVGQVGTGDMSSTYNTVVATYVRYPWVDLNADRFIQANEIVLASAPLSWTSGYDYNNPSKTSTTGTVDPNLTADTTNEVIVTLDRQLANQFAIGASYIWRRYDNFRNNDLTNWDASNWTPVQWAADPATCPPGASCPQTTYYVPTSQIPVAYVYTNVKDFYRSYQGVELTARKRFSQSWQLNGSFSYNDAPMHFDSPAGYTYWTSNSDPTNIESTLNGSQYAPESTSSGLGNVFINATWIARVSGSWTIPWGKINIAGFYNTRQGYPYIRSELTLTRPFSAGTSNVFLEKRGDLRLPNFQTLDFHADRTLTFFNRTKVVVGLDVFQALNVNTILSERGTQNASNANTISSIVAPRVLRFGARLAF
jgi:carboxypeptidase family protein